MEDQILLNNQLPQNRLMFPSKKSIFPLVISVLFGLSIVLSGFLIYQNILLQKQVSKLNADVTADTSTKSVFAKDVEQFAGWKTYTNNKIGFSFKYPPLWKYLEVSNSKYQTLNDEIWLTSTEFPMPQTGARSDIVFVLTSGDPSQNWQPQNFNNYSIVDYQLGNLSAKKITGINKEGLNQELVIMAKVGKSYLQILANDQEDTLKYFDQILSTFKFNE